MKYNRAPVISSRKQSTSCSFFSLGLGSRDFSGPHAFLIPYQCDPGSHYLTSRSAPSCSKSPSLVLEQVSQELTLLMVLLSSESGSRKLYFSLFNRWVQSPRLLTLCELIRPFHNTALSPLTSCSNIFYIQWSSSRSLHLTYYLCNQDDYHPICSTKLRCQWVIKTNGDKNSCINALLVCLYTW